MGWGFKRGILEREGFWGFVNEYLRESRVVVAFLRVEDRKPSI